ncbi:YveK family protein [Gephyromycinifex aptenodytis]|uniref:hypothetical protein n=1 Tax=Gephyromycinifex aptenodytis TaxID=2716227 RepID=UPI001445F0A5|nr:hypothetical protein [Gephyromycinifex aptenodytis]
MSASSDHGAPVAPLSSMLRHPVVFALCLALGLLLGIGAALALPASHTAESRVAVVPANTNAYNIAGYPVGARELASDFARWVQNETTADRWTPEGVSSVSASPIPDSAVIRIEVQAGDADTAVKGAQEVAETLVATAAEAQKEHDPATAYRVFKKIAPKVAAARADLSAAETQYARAVGSEATAAKIKSTRNALVASQTKLAEIQLQQDAAGELYRRLYVNVAGNSSLKVISPAATQGDPGRSTMIRYGLLGLGAGGLIGLLAAVLMDRRRANHG